MAWSATVSYTHLSDNIAHRIPVETGLVGDGETEITSGLSGGETLVLSLIHIWNG